MATRGVGATLFLAAALKTKFAAAICCCQELDPEGNDECFKGNSEDKKKVRFTDDGKTYCCKARSSKCDWYKYKTPVTELPSLTPTTIEWMDEFGVTSTESAVPAEDTCQIKKISTTSTTATTITTTTTTTIDPHRFENVAFLFGEDKTTTIKDVEYRCCCKVSDDGDGVVCEVKEGGKRGGMLNRLGCGTLFGNGYHSFLHIAERFPEFGGKAHSNQCYVQMSGLPEPVLEAALKPSMIIV